MTARDYGILAACLGVALKSADMGLLKDAHSAILDVAARIALEAELDNPRFNQEKFTHEIERERESATGR